MRWHDELENAYDGLTSAEEAKIEAEYSVMEKNLHELQKKLRLGREDINEELVKAFIELNETKWAAKLSQAFLFHRFYELEEE
jgi:hypothetical protein